MDGRSAANGDETKEPKVDLGSAFARQFGNPSGLLGTVVGRMVAKGNAGFNEWLVEDVAERVPLEGVSRLLELGHGPGVGLGLLVGAYSDAKVTASIGRPRWWRRRLRGIAKQSTPGAWSSTVATSRGSAGSPRWI